MTSLLRTSEWNIFGICVHVSLFDDHILSAKQITCLFQLLLSMSLSGWHRHISYTIVGLTPVCSLKDEAIFTEWLGNTAVRQFF